jgi:phosphatidylcholine synthase
MHECKKMRAAHLLVTPHPRPNLWAAWFVHLYTASGAIAAFLGALAVFNSRYRDAFLLMALATVVDATDGVLARAASVKNVLPGFDGARLDDIVDYLTFVFLPALLLYQAGTLPEGWGIEVASAILLSSAYGFASIDAKTDDHFFTGFPSYWNIVALYLYAARLQPAINAVILLFLSVLVFVRIGYVYPSRTPTLRVLTIALSLVWAVLIVSMILMLPDVPRLLLASSLFFPAYYAGLSLVLHSRRSRSSAAAETVARTSRP